MIFENYFKGEVTSDISTLEAKCGMICHPKRNSNYTPEVVRWIFGPERIP